MSNDAPLHYKLRLKIGDHEFEAEGPSEWIAGQLANWPRQISAALAAASPDHAAPGPLVDAPHEPESPLDLFSVDRDQRRVALRVYPGGSRRHADAALMLLYGHHLAFGEPARKLNVMRLKAALVAAGCRDPRMDRILEPYVAARLVRKAGRRIGSTYELTPAGIQRAETLVRTLRPAVPAPAGHPNR